MSDAESFPFRPYNFTALMALSMRDGMPFKLGASWLQPPNAGNTGGTDGATGVSGATGATGATGPTGCAQLTSDLHGDASCGTLVAHTTRMLRYPGGVDGTPWLERRGNHGNSNSNSNSNSNNASAAAAAVVHERNVRTRFYINNWWIFDRTMVRAMIDRTELLARPTNANGSSAAGAVVAGASTSSFVDYFGSLQITDSAFWGYAVEHLTTQPGATMRYVNLLDELHATFPAAAAACCRCATGEQHHPCARSLDQLWGGCFQRHGVRNAQLATFVVERLGIFGLFGNEMDAVPDAALLAEPRLSWVVNNAYRWRGAKRISNSIRLQRQSPTSGPKSGT